MGSEGEIPQVFDLGNQVADDAVNQLNQIKNKKLFHYNLKQFHCNT